jgi:glucose-6-phosphate isomerase
MPIQFQFKTNANHDHNFFQTDSLNGMFEKFKQTISDKRYGFFDLTSNDHHIQAAKKVYKKFSHKKYFVQVGIGGSALGPQMLVDALNQSDVEFIWFDNTDAEYIARELKKFDPRESLFYIVSKSGGTAETMASFAILRAVLNEAGVHENQFQDYFVLCTDPDNGDLRELAQEQDYTTLEVPQDIGGRFSVFSSVGLLPALFAKIDIEKLYAGAEAIKPQLLDSDVDKNPLLQTAAHLAYLKSECSPSVNQTILMPYSSLLKTLSHWFVQLWGESLGKFSNELNKNTGLTPIPAYGATDQHSQMQLFMEGENDKCLFLLEVKEKDIDFKLDNSIGKKSSARLNGHTINQLIEAQFHGTLKALEDRKRNVIHLQIEKNNEKSLGALVLYFESLTALMGHYLEVDPFDQPGVELGKVYAYEYLAKLS